jgi:hypothetical protein
MFVGEEGFERRKAVYKIPKRSEGMLVAAPRPANREEARVACDEDRIRYRGTNPLPSADARARSESFWPVLRLLEGRGFESKARKARFRNKNEHSE